MQIYVDLAKTKLQTKQVLPPEEVWDNPNSEQMCEHTTMNTK